MRKGELRAAVAELRQAIALNPRNVGARENLAKAHGGLSAELIATKRNVEAVAQLREALRLAPTITAGADNLMWANNLAWLLATSPDAATRNGAEAVTWAKQAVAVAGAEQPQFLDTLAAAYAESGQFDEAVKAARQFIDKLSQARQSATAASAGAELDQQLEAANSRLRKYEASQAYRHN
jgi:tetratricopeptide (TPR) repeat protein